MPKPSKIAQKSPTSPVSSEPAPDCPEWAKEAYSAKIERNGPKQVVEPSVFPGITFEQWFQDEWGCVAKAEELLFSPLSDEPTVLSRQLAEVEPYYSRLSKLLADSVAFLDRAKYVALMDTPQDLTANERKIRIEAATSEQRRVRDIISGYREAIRSRCILGISIGKSMREEPHNF